MTEGNIGPSELNNKISTLRAGANDSIKGWDALNEQIRASQCGEVYVNGIGNVSIVQPHESIYERGNGSGSGNLEAEMVIKVKDRGSERYFKRTGFENSRSGTAWEYENKDYRMYSEYYEDDTEESSFKTTEVHPRKVEITIFE